ncbi:acyl carrier protein [Paraburkholderia sp.]|uniref:acyl carrier protein n=1 Tax=Paraburkholderia sp. TaxID=1926495 RepID=UPI0023828565|nr:acyl carrier protein [Paraburkholderia sp.]MDE1182615.1 acyl carrier protein [Paraburkholderia sp.]
MKAELRRILAETACLEVPVDTLTDQSDLYAAGLSSLGTVRVMMALEDEFGIQIPGELITHSLFQSIDFLADTMSQLVHHEPAAQQQ